MSEGNVQTTRFAPPFAPTQRARFQTLPTPKRAARLVGAMLTIALSAAALWTFSSAPRAVMSAVPSPTSGKPNIILISLDTLRADHLGCYGYSRATSPAIDAFAAQAVRFEQVISESCWTLPSHMTLFTGLYPTTHGVMTAGASLSAQVRTLPEILKANGYRTFAYTGGGYVAKTFGFGRGFDEYVATSERGLAEIIDRAERRLDGLSGHDGDSPLFLFLHAYDLHAPYECGQPYDAMFASADRQPFPDWARNEIFFKDDGRSLTPDNIRFLMDQYDGGIRRADDLLAPFFAYLKRRRLMERSIVVFLSDHGEEFGEHGFVGHRGSLHRECVTPPLIIAVPGVELRVSTVGVGLKDVMPTLLDLAGIPAPSMQGRSLKSLLEGHDLPPAPLFSEVSQHASYRSLAWDNKRLILKAYSDQPRLYDWTTDPSEQINVAEQHPGWVADLMAHMPNLPESYLHPETAMGQVPRQLRSLGYITDAP